MIGQKKVKIFLAKSRKSLAKQFLEVALIYLIFSVGQILEENRQTPTYPNEGTDKIKVSQFIKFSTRGKFIYITY
jgi:hypothetical protein